ncbi:hypothetical protein [Clostridium felsineum]|uniref:Uncharacterized protein n=1 Tax=Clostridium felsineum TaxID=36839 RepID=A0A1S8M9Q2_9CLOT|nr:hypothetical protein [Clostridium felsineum]MCR3760235.1 hypothetical protein [Clostridium felsineum]URZ00550.1 hypothetical protein CLAUR_005380 [Clostridium felsineum]URZ06832.1 hypothetical protein CLROS_021650 [Clostridium felsineum]URZ11864.1 hypothetical protein CROST_025810 [Clostridium felsineum]URZ16389.1 hypothetical protein CLFE_024360 [Clostridium felsineum DSM 794]
MKEFKEIYAVNYDYVEKTYLNILNKITMDDIKASDKFFDLKSRKTYVVIEGEEIYIKFFEFPRVSDEKLYYMINNELKYLYHGQKRLIFSYRKIEEKLGKLKVVVFFISTDNLKKIEEDVENKNIKAIKMIQFCFVDYYKKIVKEKSFVLCFLYREDTYIVEVKDGYIYANGVYSSRNKKLYSLKNYLSTFIENNVDKELFSNFYVVEKSIEDKEALVLIENSFNICNLKRINKNELTKLIV